MNSATNVISQKPYLFISHFTLKVIAVVLMTVDHFGLYFLNSYPIPYEIVRGIGRLAFPLFAFMAVQGVIRSHNAYLYALRMTLIGGIIDLLLFILTKQYVGNSMFELGLGILALALISSKEWYAILSIFPMGIMILSDFPFFPIRSEYGTFGLLIMLGFFIAEKGGEVFIKSNIEKTGIDEQTYRAEKERLYKNLLAMGMLLAVNLIMYILYRYDPTMPIIPTSLGFGLEQWSIMAGLIIFFYSGKQGFHNPYVNDAFYFYYPLHFLILLGIYNLVYAALSI